MKVNIAHLKNNLSRYIHRVSEDGEVIIVCDRDRPVACITPINSADGGWQEYREAALARAEQMDIQLDIPPRRTDQQAFRGVRPSKAPDGRIDVNTIDLVRKGF